MVGKHGYDFQLILRLNADLKGLCDALWDKRFEKNDLFGAGGVAQLSQTSNLPDGCVNFVSAATEPRLTANSRIYVVGHGNPESTAIGIHDGDGYNADAA